MALPNPATESAGGSGEIAERCAMAKGASQSAMATAGNRNERAMCRAYLGVLLVIKVPLEDTIAICFGLSNLTRWWRRS